MHKELEAELRKRRVLNSWPMYLPAVAYHMNTKFNETLGFSASEALFGRNISLGALTELSMEDKWKFYSESLLPLMKGNLKKSRMKMKRAYDRKYKVKNSELKEGDVVYVHRPKRSKKKLHSLYDGPYVIDEVVEDRSKVYLLDVVTDLRLKNAVVIVIDRLGDRQPDSQRRGRRVVGNHSPYETVHVRYVEATVLPTNRVGTASHVLLNKSPLRRASERGAWRVLWS
eukprot:Nk52_evm1s619 gene=Nk52_evmTU1s619